jgi:hypothetical protein
MTHVTTGVVIAKALTLVLGGLVTYFSYSAYSRTGSPALRSLAIGFGVVTLGSLFAGVLDQVLPLVYVDMDNFMFGVLVESWLTAIGFGVIVYSLYAD